jgi:protein SPT2
LAQPDEDDYGYVSQEASAFYDRIMEKYTSVPSEEPKFSKKSLLKSSVADLNNTKVCWESIIIFVSLSVCSIFKQ